MKVYEMMRTHLFKVAPDAPILFVIRQYKDMIDTSRMTYVVDDRDKLLGVVTIFDLLQMILPEVVTSSDFYKHIESLGMANQYLATSIEHCAGKSVQEIMQKNVETVGPEDMFIRVHKLLIRKEVTAMPVVDKHGNLVGELTRRAIIHYIAERA